MYHLVRVSPSLNASSTPYDLRKHHSSSHAGPVTYGETATSVLLFLRSLSLSGPGGLAAFSLVNAFANARRQAVVAVGHRTAAAVLLPSLGPDPSLIVSSSPGCMANSHMSTRTSTGRTRPRSPSAARARGITRSPIHAEGFSPSPTSSPFRPSPLLPQQHLSPCNHTRPRHPYLLILSMFPSLKSGMIEAGDERVTGERVVIATDNGSRRPYRSQGRGRESLRHRRRCWSAACVTRSGSRRCAR